MVAVAAPPGVPSAPPPGVAAWALASVGGALLSAAAEAAAYMALVSPISVDTVSSYSNPSPGVLPSNEASACEMISDDVNEPAEGSAAALAAAAAAASSASTCFPSAPRMASSGLSSGISTRPGMPVSADARSEAAWRLYSAADAAAVTRSIALVVAARDAFISSSAVPDDELAPGTVETTAVDSDTGPAPAARGERSSGEPNPPWSGKSRKSCSSSPDRLNTPVVFMVSSWSALDTKSSSSADLRAADSSSSSSVIPNLDGVLFRAATAASAASSCASE